MKGGGALRTVAVLYLGIIVGVSLIATPAKFLAPTLTLAELLDVGRQTFGVFAWVEYAFALALVLLAARGGTRAGVIGAALVAAVVLLQHLVLRPPLDARVTRIIAGETVEPSMLHHLYTAGTVAKLVLLVVVARAGRRDAVAAA